MRRLARAILSFGAALLAPLAASALDCQNVVFRDNSYALCKVDMAQDDLRLFLYDKTGEPYGYFSAVNDALASDDQTLGFAMNGGMYHTDRAPVGYYVEDGKQVRGVVPNAGPGNFGLLPNGILCFGKGHAEVIETLSFLDHPRDCRFATQSGPMLVIDGQLHPKFLPDSTSYNIRNGVGTSDDGRSAVFVISNNAVTFHDFAAFFRDGLGLNNALFLEGSVSRLYAPSLDRNDLGRQLGPIVGAVVPLTAN
ncbi:phosphodiester glycosidase family protein [Mesobacterium sp. TK19101]|uniref:Phosphodiester glycosidase family protein n=1 Tax=Mesobacterium hydrothermale TaxID=3111907 RepID=A0ABU6HN32_9RHOB|nr:phosphodiester glycosidase family protein [Mesobacterium sp. TK19101]MEC3863349.1 phosphodiester glycosidase family protein [Mesobacterium sp. TK19101]